MLKVFLIEDEFVVREGIKKNIDWKSEGFDFCGEASDGELAYPLIRSTKPDIVITDICMPFMDGLEISRMLKKEMPEIKIIVLSGHEEFEYAKEAIKIGIEEYLLKPINGEDLLAVVAKVGQKILEERKEKENIEKFKNEMEENEEDAKRNFFNDLIRSNQPVGNVLERGKQLKLELSAPFYNIILFKVQRVHGDVPVADEEFSNRLLHIRKRISENFFENGDVIEFNRNLEGVAFLLKAENAKEIEMIQKRVVETIENIVGDYQHIKYFGGIGSPVTRLRELEHSFEDASRAFAYRFILEKSQFLECKKIEETSITANDTLQISMIDAEKLDKKKVEYFLRCGEKEDIPFFVDEYLKNIGNSGKNSLIFRQYIIMDMYITVAKFMEGLGYKKEENKKEPLEKTKEMTQAISTIENSVIYIERLFEHALNCRNEVSRKKSGDIIDKTKRYIEDNFMNEDLSLNAAASYVNISPSHLSAVFSQEMGVTFVKYLTDYRMNKAKELLKCSNKRSNEISMEIGYKDPHYFSYLFKKTQGCTPMQYRGTKGSEE